MRSWMFMYVISQLVCTVKCSSYWHIFLWQFTLAHYVVINLFTEEFLLCPQVIYQQPNPGVSYEFILPSDNPPQHPDHRPGGEAPHSY